MKKVVGLALCCASLMAHGFHSSLASLDYVTKDHALQAILVVNAGDLETLLRRQSGRQIELDRTADAAKLASTYIAQTFQLRMQGKEIPLHWVGMEVKTNFVYVYVEAEVPEMEKLEIRNSVLTDLLPDQVNLVSIRRDGKGKPFDCTFQQGAGYTPVIFSEPRP